MSTQRSKPYFFLTRQLPLLFILVGTALILATVTSFASFEQQSVDQGKQIFEQKCIGCHTIGSGPLVGPDLKGVTGLRDRQWLSEFILDPNAKFDSGDELANQLLTEYNNIRMPSLGLSAADVDSVLLYLESSSEPVQPSPTAIPAVGGAAAGKKYFTGETALVNGGTPCIACHTASGIGPLDGGTLGPDLNRVLTRYGEPGLTAALTTITFPSMTGIFTTAPLTPEETADLVAYFKEINAQPAPTGTKTGVFFGVATGFAVLLFGLMLVFWPRQRESISDKLRAGKL